MCEDLSTSTTGIRVEGVRRGAEGRGGKEGEVEGMWRGWGKEQVGVRSGYTGRVKAKGQVTEMGGA